MEKLGQLYQKVSDFERGLNDDARQLSQCRLGCSRCCYTELAVFPLEARSIEGFFRALSTEDQNALKEKWKRPLSQARDFHEQEVEACPFLIDESCTIYEARPLICRTQGLGLKFAFENQEAVDICPKNESMLDSLADSELLNLDLLNTILSHLELEDANGKQRPRISLKELRARLLN